MFKSGADAGMIDEGIAVTTNVVDSHVHIWTPDIVRFPRASNSTEHTRKTASFTPEQLLAIATPLGVERVVLIQMNFYGTDNSYMLDAIRRFPTRLSGVAIVDHEAPTVRDEVPMLASQGVRGFRIWRDNYAPDWLETESMVNFWRLVESKQLAICALIDQDAIPALDRMCARFPDTTVVIDHMARIGMGRALRDEDISALTKLVRHPRTFVKISAFYALGTGIYPYNDLLPNIRCLYHAFGPERLMWGSDAPFQAERPHKYEDSLAFVRHHLEFFTPEELKWLLRRSAESVFF